MKIAVFITGWNQEYLQYIYEGLDRAQREFHDEICVFCCFAQLGSGNSHEKSEFEFYQIADLSEYDGVIFASTTIKEPDVKQRLIEWILGSGKPCVTIDEEIPGFSSVSCDQWSAMQDLVDHLAQEHDAKRFGFLVGYSGSYESGLRRDAVMERVEQLGLTMCPEWVIQGDYKVIDGEAYGELLLQAYELGMDIPDAVLCANDLMAAGLAGILQGTPLEGKVAVTGFDRYLEGEIFCPSLTTVQRPRQAIVYESVHFLRGLIQDKICTPQHRMQGYRIYVGQSCGCDGWDEQENERIRKRIFENVVLECRVDSRIDSMEEWIANRDSLEEIMHAIRHFLEKIQACSGQIYLAGDLLSEEKNDYCNCTELALDWRQKSSSGDVKMVIPLQYRNHRMGYCVVSGVDLLLRTGRLEAFFRSVCYAMENCIQRRRYQDINQKYQRLYRIDQLTGIYNRFGMEDIGQEFYHKNCMEHVNTVFIFCDINRLKYINDNFGHEVGDWVIKTTGKTLGELEVQECLPFRYGGDEFVVITTEKSGVDKEIIRERLNRACKDAPAENLVEVSMGVVIAPWDEPENMDHYLGKADGAMYEEKKRFHEKYGDRRRRRDDRRE